MGERTHMKCPNCGAELTGETCDYCGSTVKKQKEKKTGWGLRLFVWLIFIFVIVVFVLIFTTVLRQFRQMPSFEDFPDVFGTESPVSGGLGR